MARYIALFAATLFLASSVVQADAAENYETALNGSDKRPSSEVMFHGDCGAECYAASLGCDERGDVSFTFADIEAKIAAKAMASDTRDFTVKVGPKAFSFSIVKLSYGGEMYGTWLVDGLLASTPAVDFRSALGKAKNFTASIGSEVLTLPVTADVKTWAKACVQK